MNKNNVLWKNCANVATATDGVAASTGIKKGTPN